MMNFLAEQGPAILSGFFTTIRIVGFGFLIGCGLGVAIGATRMSHFRPGRIAAAGYVELLRNTPFLVQATLLFALDGVLRMRLMPELIGIASVSLYTAAYMAEIIRGAMHTISEGQRDAARALELHRLAMFRLVVFPQLLPFVVSAGANLAATVTKESAFLSAVSVAELTFTGQVVIAKTFAVFEVWAVIGVLYLVLVLALLGLASVLERRMAWVSNRTNRS